MTLQVLHRGRQWDSTGYVGEIAVDTIPNVTCSAVQLYHNINVTITPAMLFAHFVCCLLLQSIRSGSSVAPVGASASYLDDGLSFTGGVSRNASGLILHFPLPCTMS